jgi:transcriptional regulator with XRE-family HTH domain
LIRGPARGGRPWKTVEEVELQTLGWAHWHNTQRLHGYLGDLPPIEFEALHAAPEPPDPGVLSVTPQARRPAERLPSPRRQPVTVKNPPGPPPSPPGHNSQAELDVVVSSGLTFISFLCATLRVNGPGLDLGPGEDSPLSDMTNYEPVTVALKRLFQENATTLRAVSSRTRERDGTSKGINHTYISSILSGREIPSARALELLAGAFNLEPEFFIEYRLHTLRSELDPRRVGFDAAVERFAQLTRIPKLGSFRADR